MTAILLLPQVIWMEFSDPHELHEVGSNNGKGTSRKRYINSSLTKSILWDLLT